MITITNKQECCGCSSCGDICPTQAITFVDDGEGFWYPQIDLERCIDCGSCQDVCPMLGGCATSGEDCYPKVYGAYSRDERLRVESSSGGLYSMLALEIYRRGGYVCGAVLNEDHTVSHICSSDPEMLSRIRGSKYLQSNMAGMFTQIKELLEGGREVLYCGTPCQVQALYRFLGERHDRLTTCDVVCLGVNSPKVFLSYMAMHEGNHNSKAVAINFKDKRSGWRNFSMCIKFANGEEYCCTLKDDPFYIGFLRKRNFMRPSCYSCLFKGDSRGADITLADFWGIEQIDPTMDQDRGTSLVIINNNRGAELYAAIAEGIISKEFTLEDAKRENRALSDSVKAADDLRAALFEAIDREPFERLVERFFSKPRAASRILRRIKKMINTLGAKR